MKENSKKVKKIEKSQIESLQYKLRMEVSEECLNQFICFVSYKIVGNTMVKDVFIDKLEKIGIIYKEMNNANSTEFSNLHRQYLKAIDAGKLVRELQTAIEVQIKALKEEYYKFFNDTMERSPFPEIVNRLEVKESVFKLYKSILINSLKDMLNLLKNHQKNIQKYMEEYKHYLGESKESRNSYIPAKLAVSILVGPLASLATSVVFKANDSLKAQKASQALADVRLSWTRIEIEAYYTLLYEYESNLKLIYWTLFGGALVRFQQDLKHFGYEIGSIHAVDGTVTFQLTESKTNDIKNWFKQKIDLVNQEIADIRNNKAEFYAEEMLSFISSNKLIENIIIEPQYTGLNQKMNLKEAIEYFIFLIKMNKNKEKRNTDNEAVFLNLLRETSVDNRQFNHILHFEPLIKKELHALSEPAQSMKLYDSLKKYIKNTRIIEEYTDCMVIGVENDKDFLADILYLLNQQLNEEGLIHEFYELSEDFVLTEKLMWIIKGTFLEEYEKNRYIETCPFLFKKWLSSGGYKEIERSLKEKEYKASIKLLKIETKDRFSDVRRWFSIKSYRNIEDLVKNNKYKEAWELLREDTNPKLFQLKDWLATTNIDSLPNAVKKNEYKVTSKLLKSEMYRTNDELTIAIKNKKYFLVKKLLDAGFDPNKSGYEEIPIVEAVLQRNTKLVGLLLKYKANPNVSGKKGYIPLSIALSYHDYEMVELILQKPLDLEIRIPSGLHAGLHPVVQSLLTGDKKLINMLKGYRMNISDQYHAFLALPAKKDGDVISEALEMGFSPNYITSDGNTVLNQFVSTSFSVDIVRAMVEGGADPGLEDAEGINAVQTSIEFGVVPVAEYFLEEKALLQYVEAKFDEKQLTEAIINLNFGMVYLLNKYFPKLKDLSEKLFTEMVHKGINEYVRFLAKTGINVDVNFLDSDDRTPLLEYVIRGDTAMVQCLIDSGADVNRLCLKNAYPLIKAIDGENVDIIKLLLNNGANPNQLVYADSEYEVQLNPLAIAIIKNNIEIMDLLISWEADINVFLKYEGAVTEEITPLMLAVFLGKKDFVTLLLKNKVKTDLTTDSGKKAVDFTDDNELKSLLNNSPFLQK